MFIDLPFVLLFILPCISKLLSRIIFLWSKEKIFGILTRFDVLLIFSVFVWKYVYLKFYFWGIFAEYRILDWELFSFSILKILFWSLQDSIVFWIPLFLLRSIVSTVYSFPLAAFKICLWFLSSFTKCKDVIFFGICFWCL